MVRIHAMLAMRMHAMERCRIDMQVADLLVPLSHARACSAKLHSVACPICHWSEQVAQQVLLYGADAGLHVVQRMPLYAKQRCARSRCCAPCGMRTLSV